MQAIGGSGTARKSIGHLLRQEVIHAADLLFFFLFPHPTEETALFFLGFVAVAPIVRLVSVRLSRFWFTIVERIQEVGGVVHPFSSGVTHAAHG